LGERGDEGRGGGANVRNSGVKTLSSFLEGLGRGDEEREDISPRVLEDYPIKRREGGERTLEGSNAKALDIEGIHVGKLNETGGVQIRSRRDAAWKWAPI